MMAPHPPRLLLVLPCPLPSATIYIAKPLEQLARQNRIKFQSMIEPQVTPAWVRMSDIVLFCRNIDPISDWILEECLAQCIPTVYDLDDNFWEVPDELIYAAHHKAPQRLRQLERYLNRVDLIRVYSRPLAERAREFNPNWLQVNPCIDMSLITARPPSSPDQPLRITYATGRGAADDLIDLFADDLQRFLELRPGAVEMTWWGEIPARFLSHPSSRMVDIIHDYDQFIRFLSSAGFDIGLAPLTPTAFNLAKTNTKFRDYGACRIAGIYSNVPVYSESVRHEQTGLLVDNQPGAWFEALQLLADKPLLRADIQEAAQTYVDRNYRQELVELQWSEIIADLLRHKSPAFPGFTVAAAPPRFIRLNLTEGAALPGWIWVRPAPAAIPATHTGGCIIARPEALPFPAEIAASILIDSVLDRSADRQAILAEIYRTAAHLAPIVIRAAHRGSLALESHGPPDTGEPQPDGFDVDTPRGWTATQSLSQPAGPASNPVPLEVLAGSNGIDLRCIQMEFFDRPEYSLLSESEKRLRRREEPGICDTIVYRCLAIKQPGPAVDLRMLGKQTIWPEPVDISLRRQAQITEGLKNEFVRKHDEVDEVKTRLDARIRGLEEKIRLQENRLLAQSRELDIQIPRAHLLAHALDAQHSRRINRLIERWLDRQDFTSILPESYRQMLDDSRMLLGPLRGFRLRPSPSFGRSPLRVYSLPLPRPGLKRIHIAPIFNLFPRSGILMMELVDESRQLVQVQTPADEIQVDVPLVFEFAPLSGISAPIVELRIFGQGLDVPVRLYEWQRRTLFGVGGLQLRPFVGLDFDPVT